MNASPRQDHDQQSSLAEQAPQAPKVRCRLATAADVGAIAVLLTRGFPERSLSYWTQALVRLGDHPTPPDCPQYGYVLEVADRLVGVILLIFTELPADGTTIIRCNVSSWYVEAAYRGFASLLITFATRKKNVTYVNISPASHTRETIEMQGFTCYARGQFYTLPILAPPARNVRVRAFQPGAASTDPDSEILAAHLKYDCLCVICETDGRTYPFVFLRRRVARTALPGAQLIYCRDAADFRRFAGPLGWFLLKRGVPCVILNANGPTPGLVGRYFAGRSPKYYKGPHPPILSDIAFTEMVLFGY
jgi:hypothetical protein